MFPRMRIVWRMLILVLALGGRCGEASPRPVDFNQDIRPLLSDRCFKCHGPDAKQRKAKLRFDTHAGLAAAVAEGFLVPGKPDASELVARVHSADPDERMPPDDSRLSLSGTERELLRRWILEGAKFQRHWSFVAPRRAELPAVSDESWCRNEIDRFVWARLDAEGLKPSAAADPRTLIRRVSYDLTGLPPTGAEADAFAVRADEAAYVRLVDRLLKSERYGERMAVDWLDAARYADTSGLLYDWPRTMWRWRDWVISAFNSNLSYRDFVTWQLAGDLLPEPTNDQIIATGFNRNHPFTVEAGVIEEEYRVNYVADRVTTMGTAFMGLTLECARCHDHKFDALSQRDFYQLFAFFNNLPESGVMAGHATYADPAVGTPTDEHYRKLDELDQKIAALEQRLMRPDAAADRDQSEWEARADFDNWRLITPLRAGSTAGTRLLVQADGSVLAAGVNPPVDQQVFEFTVPAGASVTGLRLEARLDGSMRNGGPGRSANGNALLTFVSAARYDSAGAHEILTLSRAGADYSQPGFAVAGAIDTAPRTGWAVAGEHQNEARSAVFELTRPAKFAPGDRLEIKLFYGSPFPRHVFGRVRFAVTGQPSPARVDPSGVLGRWARIPRPRRRSEQQQFLRYYYRAAEAEDYRPVAREIISAERKAASVRAAIPQTMIMQESPGLRPTHVLLRGTYDRKGEVVGPGTPGQLPAFPAALPRNRLGLAAWLTSRDQPLTARVLVNRVWAQCFGLGLVRTPENFGSQGSWPSHPELLDWLAVDFMEHGWDVKRLVRQIVTSATYRQVSATSAEQLRRDPENLLLARGARFRLPAEMVRDTALAVSGLLREKIGGPSVKPYQPDGLWRRLTNRREYRQIYEADTGDDLYRRSLYTFWKRAALHPAMAAFDAPTREVCTVRRRITNTPQQALVLLNDPQFVEAARRLAQRMMAGEGFAGEAAERISRAFLEVTARHPEASELAVLADLHAVQRRRFAAEPDAAARLSAVGESAVPPDAPADLAAYAMVARALLNLSETITRN